ncbi:MAG: PEP-CTERM sorting domain-containing protein [Planctomycetia bacterium]|nr:PEP-CTERM sorting domain-containing protein [Planctomycetia bacterium]
MSTSHTIVRTLLGCCLVVALLLFQATASAETLMIEYTGLNISYIGDTITEVGNPDPLTSLVYSVDGVQIGPTLSSDIAVDLSIPGVSGLSASADTTITSATGGTLDLTLPGGKFLKLELGAATVSLFHINVLPTLKLHFALGAADANVLSQSLPGLLGGWLGDDIAVSFSSQVTSGSMTSAAGVVTGFLASGTGEIQGNLVPEPATVALLISGLLACLAFIRRRG